MTEQQKYKIIKKFTDFEIRDYEPCLIAEVSVDGSMNQAGSYGFRPLFNYISQNNISMTAPVIQIPVKNDQWKISFVKRRIISAFFNFSKVLKLWKSFLLI